MPDFYLEFTVPDVVQGSSVTSTFYWASNARSTFESSYGPNLGGLGPVATPNVDFVRIAAGIFAADRSTLRRRGGSNWNSRDIGVTVPVNDPSRWQSVRQRLEEILGFVTGDKWRLTFVNSCEAEEPAQEFTPGPERVVLLSGGADSAIGALKSMQTVGPGGHILVSHVGATNLAPIQRNVASAVDKLGPDNLQEHLQISFRRRRYQVNGAKFRNESSSRSRSLLFLAFGLAVASRDEIPLWIPENGFASLNPPLGPERRGSLSTRTTHPTFLEGLSSILESVGAHGDIVNPFISLTKGEMFAEVSKMLGDAEASNFLSLTHSCGATGQRNFRVPIKRQCGVCFGCTLRKASFRAAGIEDATDYIVPDPGTPLAAWLEHNNIEPSIRAFIQRGVRSRDIATLSLPSTYSPKDALDICQRGLNELQSLYT